ncbi:MAG: DUF6261 family protein [Tannerella sp.]|jgi:hypothetical protein|nr:DUF6261 family protein [Tannerella sp.]
MNLINSVRFSRLRAEAHYQFLLVFINLVDTFHAVRDLVAILIDRFRELLAREEFAIDFERKSPITKKLGDADHRIDKALTGMRSIINANLYSSNTAEVDAAQVLEVRFHTFGNIRQKPYEEESTAVQILVRELQQKYVQEVVTLGLVNWLNELGSAEQLFTQLFVERNAELANRPKESLREIRREIEDVYSKMIALVEADAIAHGNVNSSDFILQLNGQVKYFNEHEAHNPTRKELGEHVSVAPVETQPYTGKAVNVIPEVHYVEEGKPAKELVFTVDFTLAYKDNVNPGTAEIVIHGKGGYKGQKVVTFNIARTTGLAPV